MMAYRVTGAGRAAELVDIPPPRPGPGQVLLDIRACGLNFADLLMQKGTYQDMPEPPFTLGMEVAGTISACGPGVEGFAIGDRVAVFSGQGGLAEQGVFEAGRLLRLPDNMEDVDAAAFQIAYGTSHLALERRARLRAGETLVVLGAAGGVGLTAVEIGKLMGARVIAVARGPARLEASRRAGADHLVDADTPDLRLALKDLGGADVVYDPVGGAAFTAAFRACRPEARILSIGFASGDVPPVPANHLLVKNIDIIGFNWGGYMRFAPETLTASLSRLIGWHAEGRLRPHVSNVLPLARVAEGMDLLRSRAATGKIVVTPP